MTDDKKKSYAVSMGTQIVSPVCDTPDEAIKSAKLKLKATALPDNCEVVEIHSIDVDAIYKNKEQYRVQ